MLIFAVYTPKDGLQDLLFESNKSPDIISLSKTKLKITEICRVTLKDNNFIRNGSATNAGGVGIFTKKTFLITFVQI